MYDYITDRLKYVEETNKELRTQISILELLNNKYEKRIRELEGRDYHKETEMVKNFENSLVKIQSTDVLVNNDDDNNDKFKKVKELNTCVNTNDKHNQKCYNFMQDYKGLHNCNVVPEISDKSMLLETIEDILNKLYQNHSDSAENQCQNHECFLKELQYIHQISNLEFRLQRLKTEIHSAAEQLNTCSLQTVCQDIEFIP